MWGAAEDPASADARATIDVLCRLEGAAPEHVPADPQNSEPMSIRELFQKGLGRARAQALSQVRMLASTCTAIATVLVVINSCTPYRLGLYCMSWRYMVVQLQCRCVHATKKRQHVSVKKEKGTKSRWFEGIVQDV